MRPALSKRWARALATLWLGLTVLLTPRARAGDRDRDLPPPGTHRLIRIGPQALVSQDEFGNVVMVDEDSPEISNAKALGVILGFLIGGAAIVVIPGPRDVDGRVIYRGVGTAGD